MSEHIESILTRAAGRQSLSRDQTSAVFEAFLTGLLDEAAFERFVIHLRDRGETVDEIVGAAAVMRRHVIPVACESPNAIDTCGTGGDGISTFNVSTAAAIVAAGAGAVVAKHGNRTNSRASGSADVLAELGVNLDATPAQLARCLRQAGIAFLFAARLHPAMKLAVDIRRRLGGTTIFNYLGPLTNPAFVRRQVIGVPSRDRIDKVAAALRELRAVHALVVHGHDGLCDLTITGKSSIVELRDGDLSEMTVTPESLGLTSAPLEALRAKSPKESAAAIRAVLEGEPGARREHTLLNAAAALVVAGLAGDLREGVSLAAQSIDSGAARGKLAVLIQMSSEGAT